MKLFSFTITLPLVLLLACTTSQTDIVTKDTNSTVSNPLKTIETQYKQGHVKQAIAQLRQLIHKQPTDEAYLLLGEFYYQQEQFKKAYTTFISISHHSPNFNESRIRAIHSLTNLDKANQYKAYTLLTKTLQTPNLPSKDRLLLYKMKIMMLKDFHDDTAEQIRTYVQIARLVKEKEDKQDYKLKAISLIQKLTKKDVLEDLVQDKSLRSLRSFLFFQIGFISFEAGDFRKAKTAFRKTLLSRLPEEYKQRAKAFLKQINARNKVSSYTIGAILPLSGEASVFGYKALRGLQLALDTFNTQNKDKTPIELAIIDSEGNSFKAKQAVQRLVTEDHVIAIVGSLMSKTAEAVASMAQKFSVPSISLSQKNDVTQIGPYVFQNALTSQMQIEFLVDTAMSKRGLKRFAVLYPNDEYGTQYTNLFWNAVLAKGGQIVAAQSYTKDETDFRQHIRRIAGTFYKDDRKDEFNEKLEEWKKNNPHARRQPHQLLKPLIFFDALFIPDEVKVIGQIAPMLAYNDIEEITLLGTNLWNTPLLAKRVGRFLKDPIFVDSFMMSNTMLANSSFYKKYVKTFNQKPQILEMQAFDTGLILKKIIEDGARTREQAQKMLSRIKNFNGVLGSLQMTKNRQITRHIVALTYDQKSGQISTLSQSAL